MDEKILWLWLNNIKHIGNITIMKLLKEFGTPGNIFEAPVSLLEKIMSIRQITEFKKAKKSQKVYEINHEMNEHSIKYIYPTHRDYPAKLLNIYNPPSILYIRGNFDKSLNFHNMNIAIVGSRTPSAYGREMAGKFAAELGKRKINIISGLAIGIDGEAHKGALGVDGYTLGILGSGIDVIYPRDNIELFQQMTERGCVISEYGLGVQPVPGNFPMRNRLISGLCDGVLVVEARKKSGSLITADYAIDQGKQIYAIPGKLMDINSEGTNNLIKNGAFLVTSYKDIMFDLTGDEKYNTIDIENKSMEDIMDIGYVNKNSLAPLEKMVYSCLSLEPTYIDDIIQSIGVGVTKAISVLYTMEERGIIKQPVKGYYIISA